MKLFVWFQLIWVFSPFAKSAHFTLYPRPSSMIINSLIQQNVIFLQLTDGEARMIVSGFSNPTALQSGGIIIGGKKYMTLRVEDVTIQGKLGAGGVSVARSLKCK